ncbi:hypothetical protein ACA086_06085 [Muriicola sp. E247]|uniref:hypothetical protein n=1 Tax=Muriicola sp. E247 TaxID=3242730 RepID=UPI00352574B8
MKFRTLLLFVLLTIFSSCKNENTYENDAELCELLAKMFDDDQAIRNLPEMTDPFFEILDSIIAVNYSSKKEYAALPTEEQLAWGRVAREITNKRPQPSQETVDSLWAIQKEIDLKNSKLLIDITKKRGWVSKEQLGCTQNIAPVIIFRHTPRELWEKIRPVVEKEYSEKRMEDGDYWFITNHLDGRPLPIVVDSIHVSIE